MKEGRTLKQSAGRQSPQSDNIVRVLFVPIILAALFLAGSIIDGLAAFPPLPEQAPFVPLSTPQDGVSSRVLSVPGTPSFKSFLWHEDKKVPVSPWHDVSLHEKSNPNLFHYVLEIPKDTHAKLEIQTQVPFNPIVQDRYSNGTLRFIQEPYPFHYGAFPQTWENPSVLDRWTSIVGDRDPVDVIDLGNGVYSPGDIVTVKVLGAFAFLGTGDETDWKIIVVDIKDPLAQKYNEASDLPLSLVLSIIEFFKFYKVPDGELPGVFGFDEKLLDKTFATAVIEDKHNEWKKLVSGSIDTKLLGKEYQTRCTLCSHPVIKREFQAQEQEGKAWVEKLVSDFLEGH